MMSECVYRFAGAGGEAKTEDRRQRTEHSPASCVVRRPSSAVHLRHHLLQASKRQTRFSRRVGETSTFTYHTEPFWGILKRLGFVVRTTDGLDNR